MLHSAPAMIAKVEQTRANHPPEGKAADTQTASAAANFQRPEELGFGCLDSGFGFLKPPRVRKSFFRRVARVH